MQTAASEPTRQKPWEPDNLPRPTSSFTIPSVHDDTLLECRVYHPKHSHRSKVQIETKVATIAHPYTPMGGCFDDHVLHAAGIEFLKQGYVLGLLNLRGAGASKGHTSWSSKPEQDDYISFVGLLLYYLDELHAGEIRSPSPVSSLSPIRTQVESTASSFPERTAVSHERVLVLGGYSYGSFIVRQLPELSVVLDRFAKPETGTAAAEIRLRAAHLAQDRLHELEVTKQRGRSLHIDPLRSPIYGGDESQPGTRRVSRESRRSVDMVKKIVEKPRAHFSRHQHDSDYSQSDSDTLPVRTLLAPEVRYLLISPLLPPVSAVLALSSHWWKSDPAAEHRLQRNQTLALWGGNDFFTSGQRLTKWATHLHGSQDSRFRFHEIPSAGHFWLEDGVEAQLREMIRAWIEGLDNS